MNKTWIWIIAVVVTIATVIYQRKTGPTYPDKERIEIKGQSYELSLPRSHGGDSDREIRFDVPDKSVSAAVRYKRYPTNDPWDTIEMVRQGDALVGYLPHQPPAGKVEYQVIMYRDTETYIVNEKPVIVRFKGAVPAAVLIPHILFIFTAQLLSLVAGLMAIFKYTSYKTYSRLVVIFLLTGGFVLGPVIQKYAFGALWTGFPFGQDLTDNKVLLALIVWVIAIIFNRKKKRPGLVIMASAVFFLINMIPHSMFGSQMDYQSGEVIQGMIMMF